MMMDTVAAFAGATTGMEFADRVDISGDDDEIGITFVREGSPDIVVSVFAQTDMPDSIAERYVRAAAYAFGKYDGD